MSNAGERPWNEANQSHLMAAVASVQARIQARVTHGTDAAKDTGIEEASKHLEASRAALPAPSALDLIARRFGLTDFERDLLVLAAGVELDTAFAALCAEAQGDPRKTHATFSLALAVLPKAHWTALTPAAPLRHWRILEVTAGSGLMTGPLRLDERVLHALAGVNYLDDRLRGVVRAVSKPEDLAPSHHAISDQAAQLWQRHPAGIVLLGGPESFTKHAIIATAAMRLGSPVFALRASDVPIVAAERELLARLWEREAALQGATLILDADESCSTEQQAAVRSFVEDLHARAAVTLREPGDAWRRDVHRLDVQHLPMLEQHTLWQEALGPLRHSLNGEIERVAGQFTLGPAAILRAANEVHATLEAGDVQRPGHLLWDACRRLARPRMEDLAQRIDSRATWEDLVLPEAQLETLRLISTQVRERFQVYECWGFASKLARGLGITALFAGVSGTGKTLAAEVLATDLHLDLYRIDLSSVVSKYIGETEKNLRRLFDAAEAGGSILLFDEADALFGKRSEVRDSHDRYANIEISYLLQRMEAYRGLAILTTNLKNILDTAFLRRLRFVVQFPFPGLAERTEIWRRVFPPRTPHEGLDPCRLAQLSLAGGNIRNIALNAAFLAAETREPVRMRHLLAATRSEYAKLERPLTDAEIGGWR